MTAHSAALSAESSAGQAAACFVIRNLAKTYMPGQTPALTLDHLDLHRGEITAILGYSGSGKSTLLNILGLLDRPDPPDRPGAPAPVEYAALDRTYRYGHISRKAEQHLRRSEFGFIFQSHYLSPHLSAQDNVAMPLAIQGVSPRQRRQRARELLAMVRLDTPRHAHALPANLSRGEALRVALLRAIAHEPRVLFADEPTGSLDPDTTIAVTQLLRHWVDEKPARTLLLVTHNFDQALQVADRIIMLQGGCLWRDMRREEVTQPGQLLNQLRSGSLAPLPTPAEAATP